MSKPTAIALVLFFACGMAAPASAQTLGYAEAIDQLGSSCRNDIAKYCKNEPLGGGRVGACLKANPVSPACGSAIRALGAVLQKRAEARKVVMSVCDADAKRLCAGVVAGDGNLLECYVKAKQRFSQSCRQAVADAGYEVGLAPSNSRAPIKLSPGQLVESLAHAEAAAAAFNAAKLRQLVSQSMADPTRAQRVNRPPIIPIDQLAQFTIAVEFDFGSARIRPDSFRAVGLMADALYHPYLMNYRFVVVGHTDGVGSREANLKLSERRAQAIRDALINPFGISPARLEAVGMGEEQLLNSKNPAAAENRRVQLINIGQ